MYGKTHTTEARKRISQKISKRNLNSKWIHKGDQEKFVKEDEISYYLANGWNLGRRKNHPNGKQVGATTKGKKKIYKNEKQKFVKEDEIDYWLNKGWKRGASNIHKEKCKDSIDSLNSFERKEKYGKTLRNTIWINNGSQRMRVPKDKANMYLSKGWKRGKKLE